MSSETTRTRRERETAQETGAAGSPGARASYPDDVPAEEEEGVKSLGKAAAFGTVPLSFGPDTGVANKDGVANGTLTSQGRLGGPSWPREDGYPIAVPAAGATNAPDLKRLEGTPAMAGRSELAKAVDDLTRQTDPRTASGPKHGVGEAQDEK
jgi:hypothetical protein